MAEVTIEWQMTVQDYEVGDVTTVERTEYIDGLIENEVVVVVTDPATVPADTADPVYPGGGTVPGSTPHAAAKLSDPPARNAKREVWAEFLTRVGIEFTDDDGRDELVDLWDEDGANSADTAD